MNDVEIEIIKKLQSIEENTKKRKFQWLNFISWALEKAIIPIMIAALAYFGSLAATNLSQGQLALAKSNSEDRKSEFKATLQSKYFEIFYRDITSADVRQQTSAITLLALMEPELAKDLEKFVQESSQIPFNIKAEVRRESEKRENFAKIQTKPKNSNVLAGYKIGIYYLSSDPLSLKTAKKVQYHLSKQNLVSPVELRPEDSKFMLDNTPADSLDVRYFQGTEDQQAQAIVEALNKPPLNINPQLRETRNLTPNFISIFIPEGG